MMVLNSKGQNNEDGSFDWKNTLIDASVIGGLTFFTAVGGLGATGIIQNRELLAAGIAAASQFFLTIAVKRGLREKSVKVVVSEGGEVK